MSSANRRIARATVAVFGCLALLTALTLAVVWPAADAPATSTGPVLQLPLCAEEDGSGGSLPCMWHGPDSPHGGLTVINFPDGSWCYPTERVRGIWTDCTPER